MQSGCNVMQLDSFKGKLRISTAVRIFCVQVGIIKSDRCLFGSDEKISRALSTCLRGIRWKFKGEPTSNTCKLRALQVRQYQTFSCLCYCTVYINLVV